VLTSGSFGLSSPLSTAKPSRLSRRDMIFSGACGLAAVDELTLVVVAELHVLRGAERLERIGASLRLEEREATGREEREPEDDEDDTESLKSLSMINPRFLLVSFVDVPTVAPDDRCPYEAGGPFRGTAGPGSRGPDGPAGWTTSGTSGRRTAGTGGRCRRPAYGVRCGTAGGATELNCRAGGGRTPVGPGSWRAPV
jgi:hypothetical protein